VQLQDLKNALENSPIGPRHYYEAVFERDGVTLRGHLWTHNGLVTVKSADGRQKTTHIGGSPPRTMAMWMLIELEEERLGNPNFTQPG
jgi:hypothetical protein